MSNQQKKTIRINQKAGWAVVGKMTRSAGILFLEQDQFDKIDNTTSK